MADCPYQQYSVVTLTLEMVQNVICGTDHLLANFGASATFSLSSYGQTHQTDDVTLYIFDL